MALTAKKVYAILKRQISDMEAKLNSPVRYRGTVATADLLPLNPDIGDMYNIESKSVYGEAGMNVAWNGVVWDTMGAPIDMSLYLTKEEAELVIQRLVTEYLEKNPVKPGATTEQAQQIEQNKTDIGSLNEDLDDLIPIVNKCNVQLDYTNKALKEKSAQLGRISGSGELKTDVLNSMLIVDIECSDDAYVDFPSGKYKVNVYVKSNELYKLISDYGTSTLTSSFGLKKGYTYTLVLFDSSKPYGTIYTSSDIDLLKKDVVILVDDYKKYELMNLDSYLLSSFKSIAINGIKKEGASELIVDYIGDLTTLNNGLVTGDAIINSRRDTMYTDKIYLEKGTIVKAINGFNIRVFQDFTTYFKAKMAYPSSEYTIESDGYYRINISVKDSTPTTFLTKEEIYGCKYCAFIIKNGFMDIGVRVNTEDKYIVSVGNELNIYYDNILELSSDNYFIAPSNDSLPRGTVYYMDDALRIIPTSECIGTHSMSFVVKDKYSMSDVSSFAFDIVVIPQSSMTKDCKILFLGDSMTGMDITTLDYVKENLGDNIKFYGALHKTTHPSILHEGRGGWSTLDYLNVQSKQDMFVESSSFNPFYNPTTKTFDFSYYISTHFPSYSDVEIVNIWLGTNDSFRNDFAQNIKTIVDSIWNYNREIKIVIQTPHLTSKSNDGCGLNKQITEEFRHNAREGYISLKNVFSDMQNVYLFPTGHCANPDYDIKNEEVSESRRNPIKIRRITDSVHWNDYGFAKAGDMWSDYFRYYFGSYFD